VPVRPLADQRGKPRSSGEGDLVEYLMTTQSVLIDTHTLPIPHDGEVHKGKVRSVYWQGDIGYMVISDRISAFECTWESESGLKGIPGKGAALNAIAKYWFDEFKQNGLAGNHIIDVPHPLVWKVKRATPIMIEAIARQYITGSMWRDYEKGQRIFGGVTMPEGLQKDQKLDQLLITPSTKGIIRNIADIPEMDDVNITQKQILDNYQAFGFHSQDDVYLYEKLLTDGFNLISKKLESIGKILVDTKFEFGYIDGVMSYIDEVGTPDSSRYWTKELYDLGQTVEESKEKFRQDLINSVPDKDVLLNKERMEERVGLAKSFKVPDKVFMETSALYKKLAKDITGIDLSEIQPLIIPNIITPTANSINENVPQPIIR